MMSRIPPIQSILQQANLNKFSAALSQSADTISGYISLSDPTMAGNGRADNDVKDTTHLVPSPTSELLFPAALSPSASTTSGYTSLGSVGRREPIKHMQQDCF